MNKFWMVYGVDRETTVLHTAPSGAPTYRHLTEESANKEAERLALAHGGTYVVLEAKRACRKMAVTWRELGAAADGDDIPF